MNSTTLIRALVAAAAMTAVNALAQPVAVPAPAKSEIVVGPINIVSEVSGVSITTAVTSYFSVSSSQNSLQVQARTFADLRDLQGKIGTLINTLPLPTDNCRSYSANNPVVSIHSKQLGYASSAAVLRIGGDVDVWDCRENPIPCSRCEWEMKDLPFGIKTKIWGCKTYSCNSPIKNRLLQQPVTATLGLRAVKASDTSARLDVLDPQIELGGNPVLAAVRDGLLNLFRVDINNIAANQLRSAIEAHAVAARGFREAAPQDRERLVRRRRRIPRPEHQRERIGRRRRPHAVPRRPGRQEVAVTAA
jgi:hypothetical protein